METYLSKRKMSLSMLKNQLGFNFKGKCSSLFCPEKLGPLGQDSLLLK